MQVLDPKITPQVAFAQAFAGILDKIDRFHELMDKAPALSPIDPFSCRQVALKYLRQLDYEFQFMLVDLKALGATEKKLEVLAKTSQRLFHEAEVALDDEFATDKIAKIALSQVRGFKPEFFRVVQKNIIPYGNIDMLSDWDLPDNPSTITLAKSVSSWNELVHLTHASVTNSEDILKKLNIWKQVKLHSTTNYKYERGCLHTEEFEDPLGQVIFGIGTKTPLADKIFNGLCDQKSEIYMDNSEIIIYSDPRAVTLICRDYAHALTIKIGQERGGKLNVKFTAPTVFLPITVLDSRFDASYHPGEAPDLGLSTGQQIVQEDQIVDVIVGLMKNYSAQDAAISRSRRGS